MLIVCADDRASLAAGRPALASAKSRRASLPRWLLWLISGAVFGRYLAELRLCLCLDVRGLGSAMVALVFLYVCASIFIYGGELNSAIAHKREEGTR